MKAGKGKSILYLLPFLVFFLAFWLIPVVYGFFMSLHNYSLVTGNEGFIGLGNYTKVLFSDSMYHRSFFTGMKNTMFFVLISTPPLVILALALALLIDRLPKKLQNVFRTLYFISYSVSVTAVAAIFVWLLRGNGGYINNMLLSLGVIKQNIPWLDAQPFAWISLLIATVWWTIGYNMMLFINALNEIDQQLYEAADIDGAGFWRQLVSIILPTIKDVFFFVLMTTIISSFNLYGQSRLMTTGRPGETTKPIIMFIHETIMQQNNMGVGNAMALLLGVIMILISMMQYFLTRAKKEVGQQ